MGGQHDLHPSLHEYCIVLLLIFKFELAAMASITELPNTGLGTILVRRHCMCVVNIKLFVPDKVLLLVVFDYAVAPLHLLTWLACCNM